ncbi:hypothetical protein BJX96DRAFT_145752 [Aspergillus floccosus]
MSYPLSPSLISTWSNLMTFTEIGRATPSRRQMHRYHGLYCLWTSILLGTLSQCVFLRWLDPNYPAEGDQRSKASLDAVMISNSGRFSRAAQRICSAARPFVSCQIREECKDIHHLSVGLRRSRGIGGDRLILVLFPLRHFVALSMYSAYYDIKMYQK